MLQIDLQTAEGKVAELKEDLEHIEQVASEKQMVVDAQVMILAVRIEALMKSTCSRFYGRFFVEHPDRASNDWSFSYQASKMEWVFPAPTKFE
jgi:hypothetical protein